MNCNDQGEEKSPNCLSEGLQVLCNLESLHIKQRIEKLELITGFETKNKYGVYNEQEEIYVAQEYSVLLRRICLGKYRSMEIVVEDLTGREALRLQRNVPLTAFLCPFVFPETFEVFTSREKIGSVEKFSALRQVFEIKDETGHRVLKIKGSWSFWCGSCFQNLHYKIYSCKTGEEVGIISKEWGGLVKETLTDADNFGLVWYENQKLDVKTKSLCLAALFFIDLFVFESGGSRKSI